MLVDEGPASSDFREEHLRLLDLVHCLELHLDRANLVVQLLIPQISRSLIGLYFVVDGRDCCHWLSLNG